jgi:hypothetical protein
VLALAAMALAWWWAGADPERSGVTLVPAAPQDAGARAARTPAGENAARPSAEALPVAAGVSADPVGGATDLKGVFDEFIASGDPGQRRIAARAFNACVPAFLPPGSQTPSAEPLIRALPAEHRAERETAYRALFARCHGFLGAGRASLEGTQRQLQEDQEAHEPGLRVHEDLLAGRTERIETLVSQGLTAADPAAVASLAGVAGRLAQQRNPDGTDAALAQRADAVDAALPWIACDLGLECSATSLAALQLSAVQGLCEGDLKSRIALRSGAAVYATEVQQQRERLLPLIRSGRPLTTMDLLP